MLDHANQKQLNFNPRSREGSDDLHNCSRVASRPISIHAPARGATYGRRSQSVKQKFQSTLPRGERPVIVHDKLLSHIFQSTLPRGERRGTMDQRCTMQQFQSTLPRGERQDASRPVVSIYGISIHAPARGATSILSKIHPMFLTISHNASSFSSFPFHSFLPHLLNSSTFCALFQVRISRAFSVYYRFAPKKSTPDL